MSRLEHQPGVPVQRLAADEVSSDSSSAQGGRPSRRQRARAQRPPSEQKRPLWMLAPGGVLMVVVIAVPLLVAVWISLIDLDQYTLRAWVHAPFIALDNYAEALTDSALMHSVGLSVAYAVIVTLATLPIGVAAALATQNRFRGRALVRSLFLVPYVLPAFVVGTVWRIMLQQDGIINEGLGHLGFDAALWLNGPRSFWALVIVQIWTSWPLIYLLTLSGLQSVDPDVQEAAALDGVGWWQKLHYVVLPYVRGPVALGLIIAFLHNINSFTLPFVLFGIPAPRDVEVLPVLTYVESFQSFRFGLSASMAILSLVLIAIPLAVYLRAVRLDTSEAGRR